VEPQSLKEILIHCRPTNKTKRNGKVEAAAVSSVTVTVTAMDKLEAMVGDVVCDLEL